MPLAISIDNYLHTHAANAEVVWMGKLGIAAAIMSAERESFLFDRNGGRKLQHQNLANSWFPKFFEMISEGVQLKDLDTMLSNVSVIIFIYDRFFEYYLASAIEEYFLVDVHRAREIVSQMTIIHPYGQIGFLPWLNPHHEKENDFGSDIYYPDLPEIASKIRTFTESFEDGNETPNAISETMRSSEVIVYLGFSYGEMNLDLLDCNDTKHRSILGTAYGVSDPDRAAIRDELAKRQNFGSAIPSAGVVLAGETCANFLDKYRRPILAGIS